MSANIETMAYAGQEPWHGLGNAVEEGISTQDMLVAAGLDWTVSKRYVRARHSGGPEMAPSPF